jgi:hypothetical protein
MPITSDGEQVSRIASHSAPVPHPMSANFWPFGIDSHDRKSGATFLLQRPT